MSQSHSDLGKGGSKDVLTSNTAETLAQLLVPEEGGTHTFGHLAPDWPHKLMNLMSVPLPGHPRSRGEIINCVIFPPDGPCWSRGQADELDDLQLPDQPRKGHKLMKFSMEQSTKMPECLTWITWRATMNFLLENDLSTITILKTRRTRRKGCTSKWRYVLR